MAEAERLRRKRAAQAVACPWCGQPPGAACMTVEGKVMIWPHELREGAAYHARRSTPPS